MIITRLYLSQAWKLYNNLISGLPIAPPFLTHKHICIVLKDVILHYKEYSDLKVLFISIGWKVSVGFRVMENIPFSGWWNTERWDRNAQWLSFLLNKQEERIDLDTESFANKSPKNSYVLDLLRHGGSRELMLQAMIPFLRAILAMNAYTNKTHTIGVTPAALDDAITDILARYSQVELMPQIGYPMAASLRKNFTSALIYETNLSRWTTKAKRKWGESIRVRHMSYEAILCKWGKQALDNRDIYGVHDPHVFLNDREDEVSIGLLSWYDGTAQHSSNDVKYCNVLRDMNPYPFISFNGGFRGQDVLVQNKDFTIALRLHKYTHPLGAIMGSSQYNRKSWQIDYINEELRLALPTSTGIVYSTVKKEDVTKVIILRKYNDLWLLNNAPISHFAKVPQTGHLYLNTGIALNSLDVLPGACEIDSVEIWHRSLSEEEVKAVINEPWPRGGDK